MFPVYGFGGTVNGTVSHCFPLNGNPTNPEVHGVDGIIDAYKNGLKKYGLSGPTIFSQIIGTAAAYLIIILELQQIIHQVKNI